jgi:hypothetical protein
MTTDERRLIGEWIEAERSGRADEADLRFRMVAGTLAPLGLPHGFAGAVAARVRAGRPVTDLRAGWWMRAAVAVSVLAAGTAGVSIPLHGWIGAAFGSLDAVAWGVSQTAAGASAWVSSALTLWGGLGEAASVIGHHLVGPAPLAVLGLNFAVAAGALVALRRLVPLQEN